LLNDTQLHGDLMIDFTDNDLDRLLAQDPGGPVVMLNLLRFRSDGGRERYGEYAAHVGGLSGRYGAEVLYFGDGGRALVADDGQAWDAVLLVRYPSRQAFTDMIRDPEYRAGAHLRTKALEEAVLQPTTSLR
jgi:uncharacterized protein (DUF1330 family)